MSEISKIEFRGEALSFEDQIKLLRGQGLRIDDERKALRILQNVSYSRLKPYFVPLMETREPARRFIPGASIDRAYEFYGLDRRLRELIFHEMEKIEISIRARLAYASRSDNSGYWFTDEKYFAIKYRHRQILHHLTGEVQRSDNDSIKRFYRKYSNPLPPCWLAFEATSFGTLVALYEALKPGSTRSAICSDFGVPDVVFTSWLDHLVYVRNICAHHNRLWNKNLAVRAEVPRNHRDIFPPIPPESEEKVYLTLCVIKYLQNTVKPNNSFSARLKGLINRFDDVDPALMGFPTGWENEPFWK